MSANLSGMSPVRVDHDAILRLKGLRRFALASIKIVLTCYLIAASAVLPVQGQTNTFAATNLPQTWSGNQTFNGLVDSSAGSATRPIKVVTLATIPVSCSANKDMILVSDAPVALRQRLCNSLGNGFDVLGGTGIPNAFVVDGVTYANLAAAFTAAGSNGVVIIPPNYAGTDTNQNVNKIQVVDLRGFPNRQRGFINVLTDCGLKGSGLDADMTAESTNVQACLNAYPSWLFWFPPTKTDGSCSYKFNATLLPTGEGTTITGGASGFKNSNTQQGGTVLCWSAGVTGIRLNLTGQNCSGCGLRDVALQGSEGTNHLVTPTLLNMPSGANLPLYTRDINSIRRLTNVLTVTVNKANSVGEALTQQVGSTIKITGVVGDSSMNGLCVITALSGLSSFGGNPITFTCNQNGADSGPFVTDGQTMLPTMGASTADGIMLCTNFAVINHVIIQNFGRHGINADSSAANANCPTNFSDDLVLRDSTLMGNQADGFLCIGTDCNADLLSGNAVYYNVMWGIHDESPLGNTYIGNQLSNGGHLWANSQVPATKAISSISRTLSGGHSVASVVLSVADANLKLGSCVFIAGVTDATFNTPAGQCFFITVFTDSTHFSYEQPGAPANSSSSGGTSRMATFAEAYLSSGVDDGAQKIDTQSGFSPTVINQYVEGGQGCKLGTNVIMLNGANTPACTGGGDWTGQFISTQGCSGLGGILCISTPSFVQFKDFTGETYLKAGITTDSQYQFSWLNHTNGRSWIMYGLPTGTLGNSGQWGVQAGSGQTRIIFFGNNTNSGHTYVNAEGASGAVIFNRNFSGSNAGGGGIENWSGGASPIKVWGVDSAGQVTWAQQSTTANKFVSTGTPTATRTKTWQDTTGTVAELQTAQTFTQNQTFPAVISSTTNPASAGFLRLAKTDAVNFRNNANSADVAAVSLNGSDQVVLPTLAATTSAVSFTSPIFISSTANPASAGQVRLAKTDIIEARNNANSADIPLIQLNASDQAVCGNVNGCTDINGNKFGTYLPSVNDSGVDLLSVASAACTTERTVAVTSAAFGNPVDVVAGTALEAGTWLTGKVTSAGNVKWQLCNLSGGAVDRASDTYTIIVRKHP